MSVVLAKMCVYHKLSRHRVPQGPQLAGIRRECERPFGHCSKVQVHARQMFYKLAMQIASMLFCGMQTIGSPLQIQPSWNLCRTEQLADWQKKFNKHLDVYGLRM
jgi:hypothetical protein